MTDKNRKLIEELERRLCWYRDKATEEEFDVEEVDAICTMLQKLSPDTEPHRTKEEAYQNIMELVRGEESRKDGSGGVPVKNLGGKKKRFSSGKKSYRVAVLFAVVFGVALLSLNMVTYARENKSLFTMILEKVGVVKIVKDSSEEDMVFNDNKEIKNFYDSWTELDSDVKSRIAVPDYIPEEYSLYGIKYWDFNNRKNIQADYYDKGNKHLLIEITLLESDAKRYGETRMDEHSYVLIPEYSDDNTLYYQYEDEYICMVFIDNNFYRISGNIELEEMIKIREGLKNIR